MLPIYYSDKFPIHLPEKHPFPKEKYALLRNQIAARWAHRVRLQIPQPATDEEILRAHGSGYLKRFVNGNVSDREIRRVGLPWSEQLVKRTRYAMGATIAACRAALVHGAGVNLGGGIHHAFPDHGRGFCWLNDTVIAARAMQAEKRAGRILVVDCDVHQGDGVAAMTTDDPTIFTFSIHGRNNFPYRKETSNLDIELEDGTGDTVYLDALEKGLNEAMRQFSAELAIYLAGADPYVKDRWGRMALSKNGLADRDRRVIGRFVEIGLPVAITMAGGYAPDVQDIVDIHLQTIETVLASSPGRHPL
jgi:acetoin utilization deacetylase AcuC-like enzyme